MNRSMKRESSAQQGGSLFMSSARNTSFGILVLLLSTAGTSVAQVPEATSKSSLEYSTKANLGTVPSRVPVEPPAEARGSNPSILFTGKLFGYFRLPNKQAFEDGKDPKNPCPSPARIASGDERMSVDAEVFMKIREDNRAALLLGTGDNFAPNYYSRVITPEFQPGLNLHKEAYEWDPWNGTGEWTLYNRISDKLSKQLWEGHGTIPTDNVACFLSYAGYTAIVPGKHDFYYGPERLRKVARFLAGIPDRDTYPHYSPVQMLAANLVIQTIWAKDHRPVADSMRPDALPFDTQYGRTNSSRKLEIEDFSDGGYVYPWLRRIKVKFTGWKSDDRDGVQVFLCETKEEGDPDSLYLPTSDNLCHGVPPLIPKPVPSGSQPQTVFPSSPPDETEIEYELPNSAKLKQNSNYGICVWNPDSPRPGRGGSFYCFRFSVFTPFFQFPDHALPVPSDSVVKFANPQPYALAALPNGEPVVIFGVVDPNLAAYIGSLNYSWKNLKITKDDNVENFGELKYKTQIAVGDPAKALTQLEQKFEKEHPDFCGLRVLLAQMPPAEARAIAAQLKGKLRFDAIISAADDALATPNEAFTVTPTDAVEFQPQCFVALTSRTPKFIDGRDDVLDRTLVLHTNRREEFSPENEQLQTIAANRNSLWSELLWHLNRIVAHLKSDKLAPEQVAFRMADFASFALTAARVGGRQKMAQTILRKLDAARSDLLLADEPIALALEKWLEQPGNQERKITSNQLNPELSAIAAKHEFRWPYGSPNALGQRLSHITTNLRERFNVEDGKDSSNRVWYRFSRKLKR